MEMEKIEKIAQDLSSWLQDAVGDVAASQECLSFAEMSPEEMYAVEAQADDIYNDKDAIKDLLGDRIHDSVTLYFQIIGKKVSWDKSEWHKTYIAIATAVGKNAHTALSAACEELIDRHKGKAV